MNLFVVLTPYHLLMSILFKQRKEGDMTLLIDQTGRLSAYGERLRSSGDFHYLDLSSRSLLQKVLGSQLVLRGRLRRALDSVGKLALKQGCSKVFVFNDNPPAVQYLLHRIGRTAVYIEDGAAPYNSHRISNGWRKRVRYRLLYGRIYDFAAVLGTSKYIDEAVLSFPQFARAENKGVPITLYEVADDLESRLINLSDLMGFRPDSFARPCSPHQQSTLILLPRFFGNAASIDNFLAALPLPGANHGRIYVKFHPLDGDMGLPEVALAEIGKMTNAVVTRLPSHLPVELAVGVDSSVQQVYGPPSTALMSIRRIFPHVRVWCVGATEGSRDPFLELLWSIGVTRAPRPLDVPSP